MQNMCLADIVTATGGELIWGDLNTKIDKITTDSRKMEENSLFIPIEGPTFDGHSFINAAFDCGAIASLTHKDIDGIVNKSIIKVKDTFKALADIARYYRNKFDIDIIGITGSVGKTTTKDMLASVLSTTKKVLKTEGNFNNEIGLPLMLYRLDDSYELGVLEMGMSGFGEIHNLASCARPKVAVITNIGMSHIEKLGSKEGILKAKLEVLDFFDKDGLVVLNGDDEMLYGLKGKLPYKTIYYSIHNTKCEMVAKNIVNMGEDGISFEVSRDGITDEIRLNVAGEHNVYNAMVSIIVARHYGYNMSDIKKGISEFVPSAMRMSIENFNKYTIINDCYNASPDSIKAALKVLKSLEGKRRVAILGDVLEMGDFAKNAHYELGEYLVSLEIDVLLTAGKNAKNIAQGAIDSKMDSLNVHSFDKTKELVNELEKYLKEGDTILVKASRGMKFELITEKIKQLAEVKS